MRVWGFLFETTKLIFEIHVGFLLEEKLPKLDVERPLLVVFQRIYQNGNRLKKYFPKAKSLEASLVVSFSKLPCVTPLYFKYSEMREG